MDNTEYLTIAEIADRYGVSENTVRKWIGAGLLVAVRLGHRTVRISQDALRQFEANSITSGSAR
jgi:excisionase family DNA binding protein